MYVMKIQIVITYIFLCIGRLYAILQGHCTNVSLDEILFKEDTKTCSPSEHKSIVI